MADEYVVVNKAFLDSTMTDTADIIRSILGTSAPIPWENDVGFRRALIEVEERLNEIRALGDSILDRTVTAIDNPRITNLGANALRQCASLRSVRVDNVTKIETSAVYSSTALTSFSAKKAVEIGSAAFRGDTRLAELDIPSAVNIKNTAFYSCWALTKVELPSVTSIGDEAFRDCKALTAIIIGADVCTLGTNVFYGTPIASGTGYIYVPDVMVPSYQVQTNWSAYASQIKGLSEVPA